MSFTRACAQHTNINVAHACMYSVHEHLHTYVRSQTDACVEKRHKLHSFLATTPQLNSIHLHDSYATSFVRKVIQRLYMRIITLKVVYITVVC